MLMIILHIQYSSRKTMILISEDKNHHDLRKTLLMKLKFVVFENKVQRCTKYSPRRVVSQHLYELVYTYYLLHAFMNSK